MPISEKIAAFIERWSKAEASERANYALFLTELCDVVEVPHPDPASRDNEANAYVFERAVTFQHAGGKTSTGRIDLYKRGCFVCECKQYAHAGAEPEPLALALDPADARRVAIARGSVAWDRAMIEAHGQAERYARSLPADEDPPSFLLIVDVGHVFELYCDFTQKGKAYVAFPTPTAHRIRIEDLARGEVRAKLRSVWTEPQTLDPAKVSAAGQGGRSRATFRNSPVGSLASPRTGPLFVDSNFSSEKQLGKGEGQIAPSLWGSVF